MNEMHKNSFAEMRQRAEAAQTETIKVSENIEMHISKTEKVRYEENDKLSNATHALLYRLLDNELTFNQALDEIEAIQTELSEPQKNLLRSIVKSIEKGLGHHNRPDGSRLGLPPQPTLAEKYKESPNRYVSYFYEAVKKLGISVDDIAPEDIKLSPVNVVIVTVRNPEA